jgi:hypothetical protein
MAGWGRVRRGWWGFPVRRSRGRIGRRIVRDPIILIEIKPFNSESGFLEYT